MSSRRSLVSGTYPLALGSAKKTLSENLMTSIPSDFKVVFFSLKVPVPKMLFGYYVQLKL